MRLSAALFSLAVLAVLACLCASCSSKIVSPPVQKPATGWVVYTREDSVTHQPILWKVRLDGTGERSLSVQGEYPRWNPSGTEILFWRQYQETAEYFFSDSGGLNVRHAGWGDDILGAEWSPSGNAIMRDGWPSAVSGPALVIGRISPQVFQGDSLWPASWYRQWYRDDAHVVVMAYRSALGSCMASSVAHAYFVMELSTGKIQSWLAPGGSGDCFMRWQHLSPDGRYLITWDSTSAGLTLADLGLGTSRTLTSGAPYEMARWGNDGSTIVIMRMQAAYYPVYRLIRMSRLQPGVEFALLDHTIGEYGFDVHTE